MKTLLDLLPAIAFFGAYLATDIYTATIALIASLVFVVIVYRLWKKEWHKAHLVTAIVASLLGGLTLYLHDDLFIKLKPTLVYTVFALALFGSHVIGDKVLLARIPQSSVRLPDAVWRKVNLAWGLFFVFCALLNLYVAFSYSQDTWVKFKTFGFTALMFVFLIAHAPFLSRYLQDGEHSAAG
jgi:intracellular septation protein